MALESFRSVSYREPNSCQPLPDYERPPVVETVLGIQFDLLPTFKNAHLGAFWKTLDPNEWPNVNDAVSIPLSFEPFASEASWASLASQLKLGPDFSSRLQIKNSQGDRMIQVQNGRLHLNWMKQDGRDYPRYSRIKDEFAGICGRFRQFLESERIDGFRPNQWEVTYVNHIPKGSVWRSPSDWSFFRLLGSVPAVEGLGECEGVGAEWRFALKDRAGRLHVEFRPGKSMSSKQDVIVVNLTARGPVSEDGESLQLAFEAVDCGHAAIVRAFAGLMSDEANELWGRRNGL